MRWGFRRFQNPDGSLTEEGRIRYNTRSQIRVIREKNRSNIKTMRAENREKIRYDRAKQKLYSENQRSKNLESERQRKKELNAERKEVAKFKKKHPLKYMQIKKYLTKDGTLNDAGRVRFYGNGDKKTINKMSTKELKNATYRLEAEQKYKNVAKYAKSGKLSSKIARTFFNAGASFAAVYGGRKIINKATDGKLYKDDAETLKAAILSMGGVFLSSLGIQGVKTGNPFNDHNKKKNNTNSNNSNNSHRIRNNGRNRNYNLDDVGANGTRTQYYVDYNGFRYYYSDKDHKHGVGFESLSHAIKMEAI